MIDSMLKIIDKAIDLVNVKQKNNKEFFQLVVSPLFDEFEKVASEYFRLFNSDGVDEKEAKSIRQGYLQSRIKVTELAKRYESESRDEELISFFRSIVGFFYSDFIVPEIPSRSDGRYYIDMLSGEKTFRSTIRSPQTLRAIEENLENRWGKVVQIYGGLKLKYGMPIGYRA